MNDIQTYPVNDSGTRLDQFLVEQTGISRTKIKKMIEEGSVLVNDVQPKKAGQQLKEGDIVACQDVTGMSQPVEQELIVEKNMELPDIDILQETDDYVVINKPSGVLVHPTQANEPGTVAHWVLSRYPQTKGVGESAVRPGIVHRLDKAASGALVIAKTQEMFMHLKQQFQDREVKKIYTVLVYGEIEADHGTIDFDIDRGKDGRMVSRPRQAEITLNNIKHMQPGKVSLTEFWTQERYQHYTLLRVRIHSGRTHQIRVHMLAYDHPVVGDALYMNKRILRKEAEKLGRLFLHAHELSFRDLQGTMVDIVSHLPSTLDVFLSHVKK